MQFEGVSSAAVTTAKRAPQTTQPDRKPFDKALADTKKNQPQIVPVKDPATPPPDKDDTKATTFGPHDPEAGIEVHTVEPGGPWPFQIYRHTPFGYETNDEVHAQLSATPWLDPKAFGNRAGNPDSADRRLQEGDKVIVLDETRLAFLEEQRELLSHVMPSASTDSQVTRQMEQIQELSDSIFGEIDYATMGQAVPDFETVAANIRARAPNDKIYQRAIDMAKADLEAKWKLEGRTKDQIGKLLEAGEKGDFAKVRQLAGEQYTQVADSLGPDATPEAIQAAMLVRAGVYTTYVTGDPKYAQALKDGLADAAHEVLIERPIKSVLDIAKAGGDGWQNKSIAKLREITDPAKHTPEQVLAIMSDQRIQHLIHQSVRHTDKLDSPEQGNIWIGWTRQDTIFRDLSAIYDATLYADGSTPGKGKALVDDMAKFIVDNTSHMATPMDAQRVGFTIDQAFFESASYDGHVALGLAVAAKAKGTDNKAFTGVQTPLNAIAEGIANYKETIEHLRDKAVEDGRFITNPLASIGDQFMSPDERKAYIDKLIAQSDPGKVATLEKDITEWMSAIERREPMQMALDIYSADFEGVQRYDDAVQALGKLPKPDPLPEAPGIAPTNTLWFQRSVRLLTAETTKELLKRNLPDGAWKKLLVGKEVPGGVEGLRLLDRASRGFSSYLFGANAAFLYGSELVDTLYVPVHGAMAVTEATKTVFPNQWQKKWLGETAAGTTRTPNRVLAATFEARINASNLSDGMKALLRNTTTRILLDPLDAAYLLVDGYNSFAYFAGKTESGEHDIVRGFAYAISALGDAAFLTGAGALTAGAMLGRSAFFWTGWGAALLVVASGVNYLKGLHDHAHEFDGENAKAWEILGIKDRKVAEALGKGATFADGESLKNAGPALVAAFDHAGYSHQEMIDFINQNWNADQADAIASFIKNNINRGDPNDKFSDEDFAKIKRYADLIGIKFPG